MGKRSRPPIRKPSIPPAGPPRDSQSSIRTTQPTPIIVPKPNVKYSTVFSPPRRRVTPPHYTGLLRVFEFSWLEFPLVGHQPRKSFESPRFAQPATFMRLPHVEDAHGLDVA